jgi:hypothetical protein
MSVIELRKIAKEHKIKLTKNGKYKTMKELKSEIANVNNVIDGEGIKHLGRKTKNTIQKARKITRKVSKNIDKYSPILEMVAPEIAPEIIATNQIIKAVNGGSLSAKDTKDFLNSSYSKELKDINGYKIDKSLSGQRVQVYHNPQNNKTVVVHRGTQSVQDWGTNLSMSLGHKGKRFNHAKKIQKQAEDKYKNSDFITLGHSQGAKWSEMLGNKNNNNEVITLNKPTLPIDLIQGKKVKKNQTDIKTSRDPVSILRGLQKGKKAKVIKSKTFNPLKEHTVNVLDRLDENEMLGVPETEGSGVPIRNFIYKKGFDPSKVKNPSKDILSKIKNKKLTNEEIRVLKNLRKDLFFMNSADKIDDVNEIEKIKSKISKLEENATTEQLKQSLHTKQEQLQFIKDLRNINKRFIKKMFNSHKSNSSDENKSEDEYKISKPTFIIKKKKSNIKL